MQKIQDIRREGFYFQQLYKGLIKGIFDAGELSLFFLVLFVFIPEAVAGQHPEDIEVLNHRMRPIVAGFPVEAKKLPQTQHPVFVQVVAEQVRRQLLLLPPIFFSFLTRSRSKEPLGKKSRLAARAPAAKDSNVSELQNPAVPVQLEK